MSGVLAVIIREDGDAEIKQIEPSLLALQAIVGGYIEAFEPSDQSHGRWHGYCDEEGKLTQRKVNPPANIVAVQAGWAGPDAGDFLVGTVVFLGHDEDGNEADVPAKLVAEVVDLYRMNGYVVDGAE